MITFQVRCINDRRQGGRKGNRIKAGEVYTVIGEYYFDGDDGEPSAGWSRILYLLKEVRRHDENYGDGWSKSRFRRCTDIEQLERLTTVKEKEDAV